MNLKLLLGIAVIAALYFWFQKPSAESILRNTTIDVSEGTLEYKEVTYDAEWGERVDYEGDLRYIGRAYDSYMPFITNDAILTTGEYSDPAKVRVTPIRNGNMMYYKQGNPEGSLVVLHFVPLNTAVLKSIQALKEGDHVLFVGREETDSSIKGSDTSFFKLQHSNHRLLLVDQVELRAGEAE